MKKKSYAMLSVALTMALLGGLSQTKLISYACEKDEYLIVNDNKDVNVRNISRLQADDIENDKDVICVERMTNVTGSAQLSFESGLDQYEDEWNVKMINADNTTSYSKNKIKVAILDSGIDYLEDVSVVKRRNFIDKYDDMEEIFEDTSGHGTSIASILAAKASNDTDIKGVNSNVDIYSAKILDENNSAPMNRVIESIYWAIEEDVDIISISFGTKTKSEALALAIKEATDKGILVVAAAGNEHTEAIEYPAAYEEVLAVGGVDNNGNISVTSSISDKIDIYAPGEQVKALGPFDGEVVVSGTSIAVPHVVGVASILWQKDITKSNEFIKELIVESANKSKQLGNAGVVDLEYALKMYDSFVLKDSSIVSYSDEDYSKKISTNMELDAEVGMNISNISTTANILENNNDLYVDSEVNYVTGSWCGKEHKQTVTNAGAGRLTLAEISLLKWGAVYSDNSENLKGMTTNPYFHGYNKKKDYNTTKKDYNYLAGYIYLTRCALAGDINQNKADLLNTSGNILEMDEKMSLINFGGKEQFGNDWFQKSVLQGRANTVKNRSLLLWGMAMHAAADVYAHSSYANIDGEWIYISHESTEIKEADNKDYEPKRYASAKVVVNNVLNNYLQGKEGSINDFILPEQYYDGSFKIRNMYEYANEITTLDQNQTKILKNITR